MNQEPITNREIIKYTLFWFIIVTGAIYAFPIYKAVAEFYQYVVIIHSVPQ